MVINRDRKSFESDKLKIPKVAQKIGTVNVFDLRSGISGTTWRKASACQNLHQW
jgi:hypothetical protein